MFLADKTKDTDMDKITVKNDNAPDLRFTGELMATASSRSNDTTRWTELELYKTQTGKFVCSEIGYTQWQGERDHYKAKACNSVEEVTQFFGYGWLAKRLYERANLDTAIDLDASNSRNLDAAETLYINTDIFGVETYIGTKEEFRKYLADCMKQWHKEAVERGDWDGEADDSLKEYTKECLNDGLDIATPEDLKKYPRLDADGNPPSTYKTASELKASKKSKGQGIK